ncbi:peptidoglycan DD-metalloendopeptidase family protein [Rathayibacter sp. VKM Ac-2759]|uniref:cell wall-binding repeat-containing protein n=1 Tax=Rathayibacter sp. VKM Ac-2759 TaxID=2609252 RepID=UPI0013182521|nr:cell wall-binding repeat-containing protein [Rathayibacter sp. VKM Ac-2759]QHC65820.1 peptidoglycan DD-metalloendopeptidase family protein [Rathayibacter sp. VKM Ac-2759]
MLIGVSSFPLSASAADGNIRTPFESGGPVYVYQGYSSGSHTGTSQFGLDLTSDSSSTSTSGRTVVAPEGGTIAYWQAAYGNLCVNVAGGRSYTLTHINASVTRGAITAGQSVGTVGAAGTVNNNNVAHLHFEYWSAPGCYDNGSPLTFETANGLRICGAQNMPASGPVSNGTWGRTAFTANDCSDPGSAQPFGSLDSVQSVHGGVVVTGWAIDPDTNDPIDVHVYANGAYQSSARADLDRPDVDAAHHRGPRHGYSVFIGGDAAASGPITVYGINAGGGNNPALGTLSAPASATPFGSLDSVTGVDGTVRLTGWALDPDTQEPIDVHIYRGSTGLEAVHADLTRDDVGAAHGDGPNHGFDITVPQGSGGDTYIVYAITFGAGPNPEIGRSTAPPSLVRAPRLSGEAIAGSTLSVDGGEWDVADLTLTYTWFRDSTPIPGATAAEYAVTSSDVGATLHAVVSAKRAGYADASARTSATDPVVSTGTSLSVTRIAGVDRQDTAARISRATFPTNVPVVYIATGGNFPDALSAAPAAAKQDGPLLLVDRDSMSRAVKDELTRLKPGKIVVVGSGLSVSDTLLSELRDYAGSGGIERIGGVDRYDTADKIVTYAFSSGSSRAWVATGEKFPDALSASAAAGSVDAPVLLVNGGLSAVTTQTRQLVTELGVTSLTIAGSALSISEGIKESLPAASTRIGGTDRYDTSEKLNKAAFTAADTVYFATGENFPDALAGATAAGYTGSPLFAVHPDCVPQEVLDDITDLGASEVILLGGSGTLSDNVARLVAC